MDTRFWGPSAWKLFHLAAESCEGRCDRWERVKIGSFFRTIPYILPCKFCRSSLTDYYREHPFLDSTLEEKGIYSIPSEFNLSQWMYTIHNCVNDKLRKQGLHPSPNPPYLKVKRLYKKLAVCPWQQQLSYVWDFLFSVAYHHPKEKQLYAKPMPDCPIGVRRCRDSDEKNKWNVLPLRERMEWFYQFWKFLPDVMTPELSSKWKMAQEMISGTWSPEEIPEVLRTRSSALSWLWKMRCALDQGYHDPYTSVCKRIANYSSDCAKQKGIFTCRRKRKPFQHAVKKTKKHTRS